ncbi:MAG: TVP38/TMEM64 family protein [Stackebrandtia sp.]
MSRPPARARRRFTSLVTTLAIIAVLATMARLPDGAALRDWAAALGPAVVPLGALTAAVAIALLIPRTAVSLSLGALLGWGPAFVCVLAGSLAAAGLGFAAGRLWGREYVAAKLTQWGGRDAADAPRLAVRILRRAERAIVAVDSWLANRGVVGIWLARATPFNNYGLLSYACGSASVRFRHFVGGTLLGALPGAIGYTAVGSAVMASEDLPLTLGLATAASLGSALTALTVQRHLERKAARAKAKLVPGDAATAQAVVQST